MLELMLADEVLKYRKLSEAMTSVYLLSDKYSLSGQQYINVFFHNFFYEFVK